jgi:hypothetical protein
MAFTEQSKEATKRLAENLAGKPWVFGVALSEERGRPILIVYLNNPNSRSDVPTNWEGFPVRTHSFQLR